MVLSLFICSVHTLDWLLHSWFKMVAMDMNWRRRITTLISSLWSVSHPFFIRQRKSGCLGFCRFLLWPKQLFPRGKLLWRNPIFYRRNKTYENFFELGVKIIIKFSTNFTIWNRNDISLGVLAFLQLWPCQWQPHPAACGHRQHVLRPGCLCFGSFHNVLSRREEIQTQYGTIFFHKNQYILV